MLASLYCLGYCPEGLHRFDGHSHNCDLLFLHHVVLLQGFTCLMGACTNKDAQVVKLLLSYGADLHACDGTEVSQHD